MTRDLIKRILSEEYLEHGDVDIYISGKKGVISPVTTVSFNKEHNVIVLGNNDYGVADGQEKNIRVEDIYPKMTGFVVPPEAFEEMTKEEEQEDQFNLGLDDFKQE